MYYRSQEEANSNKAQTNFGCYGRINAGRNAQNRSRDF